MFEYTSKYCIIGMMSKNSKPFDNWKGFIKNKNNAVSFDKNFIPEFKKVSFSYIYEKPSVRKSYKNTQIVSKLDDHFFRLNGKEFKEIRETRNKFNKIVYIKDYKKDDVMGLINFWDQQSGQKYGWNRHSGYDRNFFTKWYEQEKGNLESFFFYINDKIVGYSILHNNGKNFDYIIRKTDSSIRNTCLYVDYKTFEMLYEKNGDLLVNWGASKGNLLKYKKKFPIFDTKDVYFYKV